MRNMKLNILMLCALSLSVFMNGCGSSSKESAGSAADVARVGDSACNQCHAASADALTGETFIIQYQRSLHAELGCESCHGGGTQHNGIGPFPYKLNKDISDAKKAERCVMCHDGVTTYNGKVAPLSSSPNFSNGNHGNPFSAEEAKEAKCARCHSHEGSVLYGKDGFTGDKSIINNTAYQPVLARNPETFNTIKCATCHEHGGNIRQTKTRDTSGNIVTWDPNGNKVTDQFDLCTSCHNITTNAGKLVGSGETLSIANTAGGFTNVSTAAFYHDTRWFRTLPSTHYDQPASGTTASGTIIEGYVIRKNAKNPCFDCHGHEFKTNTRAVADPTNYGSRGATTFTDWAQSGHAGKLLKQKVAAAAGLSGTAQVNAVMKAGVTEASGPAWSHYDWDASSRASCQRCHTSTGASNFMNNPAVYNAANNRFTHLAGWSRTSAGAVTSSGQNELLNCWGCHSNPGTGKLYSPGARTETYTAATTGDPATTISYPDVAGSNVCMTCHLGREVGDVIKNDQDADGVRSFVNSHYLTAGGQLFGKSGYTYTGRDYSSPSNYKHDVIGTAAASGTGSSGPCVGCHMSSPNKHRFTNVSTNSSGAITKVTSTVCTTCHGTAMTPAVMTTLEKEYRAALEGIKAALAAKGIHFGEAYPYFFTAPYVAGGTGFTNWASVYGLASWKDVMGAAFNANLLIHDPGGFAHNSIYNKRLIWDSIDFIDDGILNDSVTATLNSLLVGQTLTDAKSYLANRP